MTTIQLSKETVQQLRQAESYPRETYDRIIAGLIELQISVAAKLKDLESYSNEPHLSILDRLVKEHNNRIPEKQQSKSLEKVEDERGTKASEAFQRKISKITADEQ